MRDISEVLSELEEQEEPKEESSNDLNKLAHSLIITEMLMLMLMVNHRSDSPNDLSAQLQRLTQANLEPRGKVEFNSTQYSPIFKLSELEKNPFHFRPQTTPIKKPERDQRSERGQRSERDEHHQREPKRNLNKVRLDWPEIKYSH